MLRETLPSYIRLYYRLRKQCTFIRVLRIAIPNTLEILRADLSELGLVEWRLTNSPDTWRAMYYKHL